MSNYNSLNHSKWDCKYHIVFIPKYMKKKLFGFIKKELVEVFHNLSRQKDCEILEGHIKSDHVHMLISIPPKYKVSDIVGFIKGKSSIWIAQNIGNKQRNFAGHKFWARGYFVSTVGIDEDVIRNYIQHKETADRKLDDLNLFNR